VVNESRSYFFSNMVEAVAFVDRNNDPMVFETFASTSQGTIPLDVEYEMAFFASLDQVAIKQAKNPQDPFMGLVGEWGNDLKIYGYVSFTQLKILLCVSEAMIEVSEIRTLCKKLSDVYRRSVCGPSIVPLQLERSRFIRNVYNCLGKNIEDEEAWREKRLEDHRRRPIDLE